MFRGLERTFRALECTSHDTERTSQSTKYKKESLPLFLMQVLQVVNIHYRLYLST